MFALIVLSGLGGCGGEAKPRTILVWEGGRWVTVVAAEGTPQGELELIRAYMKDEEYSDAIKAAEKFFDSYPDDYRRENVAMLAGNARMKLGHYIKAHEWYNKQLNEYPAGDLSAEALEREYQIADEFLNGREQVVVFNAFGLGEMEISLWLSAITEAMTILDGIAEHIHNPDLAERALLRKADYYFAQKRYYRAAEAYDNYLTIFPDRPKSPDALLQAARSFLAAYRDARYDSTPLVDANLRYREFRAKYRWRAQAEGVDKILLDIADRRAGADYYVAQLFERIERPQAAFFFYNQAAVLFYDQTTKSYEQTVWTARAAAAAKRLADLLPKTEPKLPGQP